VQTRGFVIELPDGPRTKRVIAPGKAWRRLSPLEQAFLRGQLAGGAPRHDAQAMAIRRLIAVDSRMSERDRAIVRLVCGLGYFPSEAVRQVCEDYKHTIPARLREALDGLVEAIASASRRAPSFSVQNPGRNAHEP
jgi:hypothetical protein